MRRRNGSEEECLRIAKELNPIELIPFIYSSHQSLVVNALKSPEAALRPKRIFLDKSTESAAAEDIDTSDDDDDDDSASSSSGSSSSSSEASALTDHQPEPFREKFPKIS